LRETRKPHRIELVRPSDRKSPIWTAAKTIVYEFDTRKLSRKELKLLIPKHLAYSEKIKSFLAILHNEGFLVKEIDQTSRNKAKELYAATNRLRKVILPSPNTHTPFDILPFLFIAFIEGIGLIWWIAITFGSFLSAQVWLLIIGIVGVICIGILVNARG